MKKTWKIYEWLAAVLLIIGIILIFVTNIAHYNYKMNSDIGAEAVLGRLIWDSREIIPSSWYPSTETRIIATPQVGALFYGMTGKHGSVHGTGMLRDDDRKSAVHMVFYEEGGLQQNKRVAFVLSLPFAERKYDNTGAFVSVCRILCDSYNSILLYYELLQFTASEGMAEE